MFLRALPRLLGATLLGGLKGAFVGLLLGIAATGASLVLQFEGVAAWQWWLASAVGVFAFAIGGACVGALRAGAAALAGLMESLDWTERLWSWVKPHALGYAAALRSGMQPSEARAGAWRRFDEAISREQNTSRELFIQRVERYLIAQLHRVFVGEALRVVVTTEAATWEDVEAVGLARVQEGLTDLIARLYHGPALLVMYSTVAVAVLPHVLIALLGG